MIKSPLRYPGGKNKIAKQIIAMAPEFTEYREPFIGGGSIYFAMKGKYGIDKSYWINDLYIDLYQFYKICRDHPDEMMKLLKEWKKQNGRQLHKNIKLNHKIYNDIELGTSFLFSNRTSFSGFPRGGFSQHGWDTLLSIEKIESLKDVSSVLQGTRVTNLDYQKVVEIPGEDVFLFLDPPYYNVKYPELYGSDTDNLHKKFDHQRFANVMKNCKHKWLITYDDSNTVRRLFNWANITEFELTYTSNKKKIGKEVFISNYELPKDKQKTIDDAWI